MDVQVDSNTVACLEIALMSPGNQRSWTPSRLARLNLNPKLPFGEESLLKGGT